MSANLHSTGASLHVSTEFGRAHAQLLQRSDLQFRFESFKVPVPPDWLTPIIHFLQKIGPYLKYPFWGFVALIVASLAYYAGREIWRRYLSREPAVNAPQTPMPSWQPTAEQAHRLLCDADALAARGQFDEAVHLLLLRSIDDIDERRPDLVRPAFTSLEIGRLGELPSEARGAFGALARAVERSLFAGHAVGAEDFARCRTAYEEFAFSTASGLKRA